MKDGLRAEAFFDSAEELECALDQAEELECALDQAEGCCQSQWEMDFVADVTEKFKRYGFTMYLSEKQAEILKRISDR